MEKETLQQINEKFDELDLLMYDYLQLIKKKVVRWVFVWAASESHYKIKEPV
jgi:hypothetical protein